METSLKIFRDPIHNVIDLDTGDKSVNGLLTRLIDSAEFQRLRFIRQLGFAYFAFPGAVHTRFEHSLGVAFLAKRFLEKIISMEEKVMETHHEPQRRELFAAFFDRMKRDGPFIIVAALLHDIGHGPLSHVTEELTGVKHEKWVEAVLTGDTEVRAILAGYDKDCPRAVADLLTNPDASSGPAKIIAGQLDIDRIDYLLRDSAMTGAGYGKFDVEWLLNVLTVGVWDGRVEIGLDLGKGLSVAEAFVMARVYMFKNIYLHKTSLVAQDMLRLLIARVRALPRAETDAFFPDKGIRRLFYEDDPSPEELLPEYLALTDVDLFYHLKLMRAADDPIVRRLADGLVRRDLFKETDPADWDGVRNYIRKAKGPDAEQYYATALTIDARQDKLSYRAGRDMVFLFDKNGEGHELLETSDIILPAARTERPAPALYADAELYRAYLREK